MSTQIHFFQGGALRSGRLGIFPGAFNPVTLAHLAVAQAARDQHALDQVVFLLPRNLPHKQYEATTLEQRAALLESVTGDDATLAIAASSGGLFIEIAREFQAVCGSRVEIHMLCGRDAAERIVHWDYSGGIPFGRQLEEFQMLVASREGEYTAPPEFAARIHRVRMPPAYGEVSSSAVRRAMERGEDWESLVPDGVARRIRENKLYGVQRST